MGRRRRRPKAVATTQCAVRDMGALRAYVLRLRELLRDELERHGVRTTVTVNLLAQHLAQDGESPSRFQVSLSRVLAGRTRAVSIELRERMQSAFYRWYGQNFAAAGEEWWTTHERALALPAAWSGPWLVPGEPVEVESVTLVAKVFAPGVPGAPMPDVRWMVVPEPQRKEESGTSARRLLDAIGRSEGIASLSDAAWNYRRELLKRSKPVPSIDPGSVVEIPERILQEVNPEDLARADGHATILRYYDRVFLVRAPSNPRRLDSGHCSTTGPQTTKLGSLVGNVRLVGG